MKLPIYDYKGEENNEKNFYFKLENCYGFELFIK